MKRRLLRGTLQGLAAFAALLAAGRGIEWVSVALWRHSAPAGWLILRPPLETSALQLEGGRLWAGGQRGLTAIDRRGGTLLPPAGVPSFSRVRDLLLDASGDLWVAHGGGVTRRTRGGWETLPLSDAGLALLADGPRLWMGCERGLYAWDGHSAALIKTAAELGLGSFDVLYGDSSSRLWAGSSDPVRGGLAVLEGGRWRTLPRAEGFAHPAVASMLEDRGGVLLFGTGFGRAGGLTFWNGKTVANWSKANGLAGERVRSLFRDRAGRYWVGSEYDGIAVFVPGRGRHILTSDMGLSGNEVKDMVEDGPYLWLGTENGLSRIPFEAVPLPESAAPSPLLSMGGAP